MTPRLATDPDTIRTCTRHLSPHKAPVSSDIHNVSDSAACEIIDTCLAFSRFIENIPNTAGVQTSKDEGLFLTTRMGVRMVVCILQIIVLLCIGVLRRSFCGIFLSIPYHRVAVCLVLLPSRSGGFYMIKESSWVYEFFYQEKKRHIEVFPLGIQLKQLRCLRDRCS